MPNNSDLVVKDFTDAVAPLITALHELYDIDDLSSQEIDPLAKHPTKQKTRFKISDVIIDIYETASDGKPSNYQKQCVDLVQEGGGVHGIALAGYTYVLEKMNIVFTKMAGTSAGSINTLLLNAVSTKSEIKLLQDKFETYKSHNKQLKDSYLYNPMMASHETYYETRSEKMLEYLAAKDLGDLVDGHVKWRQILLRTFIGTVNFKMITDYIDKVRTRIVFATILLIVSLIAAIGLSLMMGDNSLQHTLQWITGISSGAFFLILAYLIIQFFFLKSLWGNTAGYGVNPGKNFEKWLEEILIKNGIDNVSKLKNKLQQEQACMESSYRPDLPDKNKTNEKNCDETEEPGVAKTSTNVPDYSKQFTEDLVKIRGELSMLQTRGKDLLNQQRINKENKTLNNEEDKHLKKKMRELSQEINAINDWVVRIAKRVPVVEETAFEDEEKELQDTRRRVKAIEQARVLLPVFSDIFKLKSCTAQTLDSNFRSSTDKEIAIVSSDITNGIKVEFPAMHKMYWGEFFDISPAEYVRASMSVPFFFQPFQVKYDDEQLRAIEAEWRNLVNLNKRVKPGDKVLFVDGGVLSNFPINIFTNTDSSLPLKPTIGVKLEYEDDASSRNINSFQNLVGAMVSTMRFFYDRDFMSKHNIYKKTVRSIDTGNIHWLNFNLTDRDKIELFFRGALSASIFLLGNLEKAEEASEKIKRFREMGSNVDFRHGKNGKMNIYGDGNRPNFKIEDAGEEDVRFNWKQLKVDRILMLSEQDATRKWLKRKAGFSLQSDTD